MIMRSDPTTKAKAIRFYQTQEISLRPWAWEIPHVIRLQSRRRRRHQISPRHSSLINLTCHRSLRQRLFSLLFPPSAQRLPLASDRSRGPPRDDKMGVPAPTSRPQRIRWPLIDMPRHPMRARRYWECITWRSGSRLRTIISWAQNASAPLSQVLALFFNRSRGSRLSFQDLCLARSVRHWRLSQFGRSSGH